MRLCDVVVTLSPEGGRVKFMSVGSHDQLSNTVRTTDLKSNILLYLFIIITVIILIMMIDFIYKRLLGEKKGFGCFHSSSKIK